MNTDVKKLLLAAWSENRLAAVHIDMQYLYHTGNEPTFRAVADFAQRLRDYAVPNAWVAFPQLDMKYGITPRITTVADFNREALHPDHTPQSMIHAQVRAHPHEPVIVKDWGSAFEGGEQSHLHRFLQD
jgi:hypothetical protein